MRKKILLFLALFLSAIVYADDFVSLELSCEHCIPNHVTNWTLSIKNNGEKMIDLHEVQIKKNRTDETVLSFLDPVEINPGFDHLFSIRKKIPYPNNSNLLILYPCLTLEPDIEHWGSSGKRLQHCYKDILLTVRTTDCYVDDDCLTDQYCEDMDCIRLNCSYCQFAKDHVCVDYGCCKDDECPKNKACLGHECKDLNCLPEEYMVNHTCQETPCKKDEGIIDFSCVRLDCGQDEYIKNHECVSLGCNETQGYFNHTCIELNCSYDEAYHDHTCVKLNCSDEQTWIKHQCADLNCLFFMKAEEHECRINSSLVLFLFLLFMIYFLIMLNVRKYLFIHNRKLFEKRYKKKETIKTPKKNGSEGENKDGRRRPEDGDT